MSLQVQIPGDFGEEIVQSVLKYEGTITKEVVGVMNQALLAIETRAKEEAPVDTGRLRSSIHAVPVGKSENTFPYSDNEGNNYNGALASAANNEGTTIGMVGTNVEYAAEQEFGNEKFKGHKYLTIATASVEGKLNAMFKNMKL